MADDLITAAGLVVVDTKADLYELGLSIAAALEVPVTSWQPGDPTRSLYHFLAEILATRDVYAARLAASAFLDSSEDEQLTLVADQVYGVTRTAGSAATCTVELSNAKGGVWPFTSGQVVVKNSTTGAIFRNSTTGTLTSGPGSTLSLDFVADEVGTESSSAVGEIDEMVTVFLGVTCASTTAAVGVDQESDADLRVRCRNKLGALSPNGPRDAYSYVALTPDLTGTTAITRARSYGDSDTGDVTLYLAGAAGAILEADRALVEAAIIEWATPLCITVAVASAANVAVAVTYTLYLYQGDSRTAAEIEEAVEARLEALFARKDIGGDIISPPAATGYLYRADIISTIAGVSPYAFEVTLAAPAANTALTNSQVATLGTVTGSIVVVDDPT